MRKTIVFLFLISLFSCKNAINKSISKETFNEDVKKIQEQNAKDYSPADFKEFISEASDKVTAQIFGVNKNDITTYREVLDSVKARRLRKEEALAVYNNAMDKIKNNLELIVYKGGMLKGDYDIGDYWGIYYFIRNLSGKNISAWEGMVTVSDPLGNELKRLKVNSSKTLNANEKMDDSGMWACFENVAQLQDTPFEKMKFEFSINKIVFEDGTMIESPTMP